LREAITCREDGKESDREDWVDAFHRDGAFRFVALKEARPEPQRPVRASDIGAMRADSLCEVGAYAVAFRRVNP
jgi:hypothetical protein